MNRSRRALVILTMAFLASGAGLLSAPAASAAPTAPTAPAAVAHGPNENGCSFSPDSGPTFNFHASCDQHDRCYHNKPAGRSRAGKNKCDAVFLSSMLHSCRVRNSGALSGPKKAACYSIASLYYSAVQRFGMSSFLNA